MKTKYALLVILFIFFADNLISQSISYILPDICSPNMNTYIEIIAPTDANGNFGIDGLTYSTGNDLKIELLNPADSQKIVFGPLVVSWNGRVISTQVFCNPWVTPNSDYWNNLNTQYRIPFRVNVGGIGSNYDTIYIVRPYHLGDIASNPERVFGEGTLGRRSRRGAMIVDSLIMADNATYRSSYTDCDPQTPASNQAYLPFILLVKGRVSGGSINTKLSVDGGVTRIQNGGPGGGGGGGRFCDYIFGSNNDYGGDGFTGGGRGGVNNIVTHDGTYTNYGSGTGTGGSSLNGVEHGQTPSSWEASGGGTGHPFGISGNGCDNGPDCNPPGGYGGGSGYKNNQAGGSGGNATSATGAGANGGKANGNIMIVPFAGGSGGASGNPNGVNVCSGSGGGGGGAIRLFSVTTSNLTITANGANGGNQGDNDKGGGGSGGAIDLSSKLSANNISLNADGGDTGNDKAGAGRIRNDNGSSSLINRLPANSSQYVGLTSDTSNFVNNQCTVTGTRTNGSTIAIYLKPQSGSWQQLTGPDYLTGNTWREQLNLISNDSLFYLVALQLIVNPSSQEYLYEPSYIMSQAAANILRVIKPPSLAADSIATFHVIDCPGSVSYDTLSFSNQGGTNLIFYFNNAYFKNGTPGFELVSPKVQTTIPPGDTIRVVLRYTYQAGQHGPAVDTLMISHNDANQPVNPWQVHCTATIDTFAVKNYSENGVDIDNFLDVGFVCIGDTKDTLIIIKNFSGFPLTIDSAYTLDKVIYTGNILSPVKMPVLDTAKIRLTFTPVIEGTFWSQLVITFKECPAYADTILLKGTGIRSRYQFIGINSGDTLDFGKVCVGDFKTLDVLIKNISAIDETIGTVTISDINNFDNTITGSSIVAPSDTATISTGFKPQTPGPFSTKLKIGLQYCGNFIDSVYLKGTGISSGLSFTSTGNFPNPVKVGDKDTLKITLTNTGTGPAYILSLPALNPPFRVIGSVPAVPVLLNPGGSVVISVEYTPLAEGNDSETLKIFSEARNGACPDSAEIRINAQAIKAHITLSKYDMDFGLIAPCKIAYDTVIVRNTGTANVSILTKGTFRGTDASLFKVIQEPPNVPYTMKPGDTSRYIIAFVPAGTTDGDKTAEFLITTDDPVDSILVVNLKGRVQGLIVSYPTTVDFGTAQAGTSVNRIYTIINNGELDAHILSITSTIPNLTIIPNSNILIPKNGGSVNITLTLHFTVAGPVSGTLKLIFDEQCNDTINSTLKGNGTAGKVQGPGNLNFGTLAPCETKTLADSIRNIGDAPFILLSMSITGTDAGLFHFTDNVTLPYQLGAGESFGRNITYDPQNSTDGQKSAILVYTVILNGDTVEVRSDLIGERASGLLSVPYEVDFGSVVIEATDTRSLTLRNISTITTRIIKVLPFSDPAFSLQPPDINVDLLPNDSIVVTVLFSPTETRDYRDTLKLAIKVGPCNDTINIIITGKGLPGGNVLLWIPDTLVEPDLNNFSLPVFGMITNNTGSLNGLSLHAILSFNATIFYVYNEGIGNGQLLSRTTSILPGNLLTMRNIEFQMNNITLTQNPSMIGVLTGSTLLGDRDTTSVTWSLADWAIGKSLIGSTTLKKGSISLKICRAGGDRLLNYISPLKMQIQPNPAFDKIEVTATLLESGVHRIELMDIKGDTRVLDAWLIQPNGNKEYSHEFVTDGIQSGIYYIRLVTPTNSITQPVFIIK